MTVFFAVVLAKKYTNPSSDIIEVVAGLDNVDAVFAELVSMLDMAIKDGRTGKVLKNFESKDLADDRKWESDRKQ